MDEERLRKIADRLMTAAQTRIAIDPPAAEANLSLADAYRIQMINVDRSVAAGRRIVGRKVGLTSLAMQKMFGVNEPDFGHLFDDMILTSDTECIVSSLLLPRVEPEIAFVLSRELRGPGIKRDDVIAATEYVTPALEIIDTRIRDWKITLADTIADNASSARVVLGQQKSSPTAHDLASIAMTLEKNGAAVERRRRRCRDGASGRTGRVAGQQARGLWTSAGRRQHRDAGCVVPRAGSGRGRFRHRAFRPAGIGRRQVRSMKP